MTTTVTGPLSFEIDRGDHDYSERFGGCYWAIGLPDGREVFLHADRIEIIAGAVVAWQDTRVSKVDDDRTPLEHPQALFALAAGAWTHFYGASVFDGDPVMVSRLVGPEART